MVLLTIVDVSCITILCFATTMMPEFQPHLVIPEFRRYFSRPTLLEYLLYGMLTRFLSRRRRGTLSLQVFFEVGRLNPQMYFGMVVGPHLWGMVGMTPIGLQTLAEHSAIQQRW